MDILAAPPFRTASLLWQPRPGAFMLTVVCKATFVLLPNTSALAQDQDPPNETDDHWNDDESLSLHAASDRVPFKRRGDVLLVGHAYAPRGQPVSSLVARLVVGSVDKAIEVYANRVWTQDGQLREGARFVKMPLLWERAAGGPHTSNPVGMRADARPDMYGHVAVPNLQPPGFYMSQPGEVIAPVGFGPIAPSWPARREKLYRHAGSWDHRTWAERPLPEDIDAAFFNVAPPDQQVDEIRSDERIVLESLHAEHTRLVTSLPGLSPRSVVERAGVAGQAVRLRCDTLCIDTDRGVCSLVWRGQVALGRADEQGRVVISRDGAAREDAIGTMVGGMRAGAVLPFGGAPGGAGAREGEEDVGPATPLMVAMPEGGVWPFKEGMSPLAVAPSVSARSGAAQREDDGTGTIVGGLAPMKQVLPFTSAGHAEPAPVMVAPPQVEVPSFVSLPEVQPAVQVEPEIFLPKEAFAPPPMIGPLASPAMVKAPPPDAPEAALAPAPEPSAPEPAALALPLDAYPIGRCAAIAASIARTKPDRTAILERNHLTEDTWRALERHWAEAIREEGARGKPGLLHAYDEAYVAQLEAERGAITVQEYAPLVVAAERGTEAEALAELGLPRGAMLRLQRVWLRKMSRSAGLGRQVREAVEAAREA